MRFQAQGSGTGKRLRLFSEQFRAASRPEQTKAFEICLKARRLIPGWRRLQDRQGGRPLEICAPVLPPAQDEKSVMRFFLPLAAGGNDVSSRLSPELIRGDLNVDPKLLYPARALCRSCFPESMQFAAAVGSVVQNINKSQEPDTNAQSSLE